MSRTWQANKVNKGQQTGAVAIHVNQIGRNPAGKNTAYFWNLKFPNKGNQMKEALQEVQYQLDVMSCS